METYVVPEGWSERLTMVISGTVSEFEGRVRGVPVVRFAIDCQPWSGFLTLALLTAEEAEADPLLLDPAEMAAWRNYGFPDGLTSWCQAQGLGREMQDSYTAASEKEVMADAFFSACALAVARAEAAGSLGLLDRDGRFQISVTHPDDGREFYPPGAEAGNKRLE